jgi:molecular chaperone DnaK
VGDEFHEPDGPILNVTQHPDEAVALGASIQGAILTGEFKDVLLLDVTPLSLGIETFGGLMNVLIPRNSTIPIKAGEAFTTAVDGQREMLIHLLQGEREKSKDNWSLGKFTLEFELAPRGVPRVGVQFEIDVNGVLHVLARDIKTGREKIERVQSAVDVDDADVQQMVEESVEHAFDDLAARRWIENRLKAKEILQATQQGVELCVEELTDEYLDELKGAISDLTECLGPEPEADPDFVGDWQRLKELVKAMDELTADLAELQMQKVMEEMLQKKGLG